MILELVKVFADDGDVSNPKPAASRAPHPATGEVLDRLLGMTGALHSHVARVAAGCDLTAQQALLLRSLDRPRSMRTVAQEMSCDPSNVTGLIDRIERLGLVERLPDAADRRVRLLSLTPAGRKVCVRLERDLARTPLFDGLTPAELDQFLDLLRRLDP
jgi:DNA-binding MarR family transcriptional regulator